MHLRAFNLVNSIVSAEKLALPNLHHHSNGHGVRPCRGRGGGTCGASSRSRSPAMERALCLSVHDESPTEEMRKNHRERLLLLRDIKVLFCGCKKKWAGFLDRDGQSAGFGSSPRPILAGGK